MYTAGINEDNTVILLSNSYLFFCEICLVHCVFFIPLHYIKIQLNCTHFLKINGTLISHGIRAYSCKHQVCLVFIVHQKQLGFNISLAKCALLTMDSFRGSDVGMTDPKKVYMSRWKA